jgi:hypothetical protein
MRSFSAGRSTDPDAILKTRMIRDRLKMLQGDDISRILGRIPANAFAVSTQLQPAGKKVAVTEAPTQRRAPATVPAQSATLIRSAPIGFHRGMLLVRSGPSAGLRYEINVPRVIVGRRSMSINMEGPVMQIDDARVSRQHLEIFARSEGLYVRDLGSANGTWLNGRPLDGEPAHLEDGAEIRVSPDSVLNFRAN